MKFTIDITTPYDEMLEEILKISGHTKAHVFRQAIEVSLRIYGERVNGNKICVVNDNNEIVKELIVT